VEREEFINIGVILFSKEGRFLKMKYHLDPKRIKAFSSEVDLEQVQDYLSAWQLICKGDAAGGRIAAMDRANRFRWLTSARSTIIQSSAVHPGLCSDPGKVLADLFDKYVL
jgi:hypothetical protein